MKIFL
jgi:hypothetical protein